MLKSSKVEVIKSDTVWCGDYFKVKEEKYIHIFSGKKSSYTYIEKPKAVGIIAEEDHCIYLVKQYRHPNREIMLEIPAGSCDGKETFLEAAKRELAEEASLDAKEWISLGKFVEVPGWSSAEFELFLARELSKTTSERDEGEAGMTVQKVKIVDVEKMIAAQEIRNIWTINAIYKLLAFKKGGPLSQQNI